MAVESKTSSGRRRYLQYKLQKWSQGKQEEKVNNQLLFDKATSDKLMTEITKGKFITPSHISDRVRVDGYRSHPNGLYSCTQEIYTRPTNT